MATEPIGRSSESLLGPLSPIRLALGRWWPRPGAATLTSQYGARSRQPTTNWWRGLPSFSPETIVQLGLAPPVWGISVENEGLPAIKLNEAGRRPRYVIRADDLKHWREANWPERRRW